MIGGVVALGLDIIKRSLQKLLKKYGFGGNVIVGYAQPYAVFVHEATAMKLKGVPRSRSKSRPSLGRYWDPPGSQAKFLEKAARKNGVKFARLIAMNLRKELTLKVSTLNAGRQIQYDSQDMVPVDFGPLIASAFTCHEEDFDQARQKALTESNRLFPTVP